MVTELPSISASAMPASVWKAVLAPARPISPAKKAAQRAPLPHISPGRPEALT